VAEVTVEIMVAATVGVIAAEVAAKLGILVVVNSGSGDIGGNNGGANPSQPPAPPAPTTTTVVITTVAPLVTSTTPVPTTTEAPLTTTPVNITTPPVTTTTNRRLVFRRHRQKLFLRVVWRTLQLNRKHRIRLKQ